MTYIKQLIAQFRLNVFRFERNCPLQLQYFVVFFVKIYSFDRQHYVDL